MYKTETIKDLIICHKLGTHIEDPALKYMVELCEDFFEDFEYDKTYCINNKYRYRIDKYDDRLIMVLNNDMSNEIIYGIKNRRIEYFNIVFQIYFGITIEAKNYSYQSFYFCPSNMIHITKTLDRKSLFEISPYSFCILYDKENDITYDLHRSQSPQSSFIRGEYFDEKNKLIDISTLEFFDTYYDYKLTDTGYVKTNYVLLKNIEGFISYIYKIEEIENEITTDIQKHKLPMKNSVIELLKNYTLIPRETEYVPSDISDIKYMDENIVVKNK